jgi:hypothetical protein
MHDWRSYVRGRLRLPLLHAGRAALAYPVAQRTHEIGLRPALGAQRRDIFRLIVGRGPLLTFAGIACGMAGALALTGVMNGMLFGGLGDGILLPSPARRYLPSSVCWPAKSRRAGRCA